MSHHLHQHHPEDLNHLHHDAAAAEQPHQHLPRYKLDNRPSTSGSDERMDQGDHHCTPAASSGPTAGEGDVEMKEDDVAVPHGCSEDCSACRELNHIVDVSQRVFKAIPVPPVVLVGRPPDTTVINAW